MRSLSGRNLGAYRLIEQVGIGGMAVIYKAYDPGLDRYVAIKILPEYLGHDEEFSVRFRNEARNVARLHHPNILPIYGYGEEDGLSYFVMGLVEGGTLKEQMGRPMDPRRTASIIRQLADALHYAHEQGIVHRDVKPANVLMSRPDWPLLSDFGIARVLEQKAALTRSAFLGTPHYMAPEQARGETITPKTDQYALGIVLYEMLTGTPPYQADTPQAVVYQHIYSSLPLPHERNPAIPEPMERVILRALAKDPADRFPDMAEFSATVQRAAGEPVTAPIRSPSAGALPAGAAVPSPSDSAVTGNARSVPPSSVMETGPGTERIDRHELTAAVQPVDMTGSQQTVAAQTRKQLGGRTLGLIAAGLVAVAAVAFGVLRLTGSVAGGNPQLTVTASPGTTLPAFTVHDVTNDTDLQTFSAKGTVFQMSLKDGSYQLQFPSDSAYRMPAPFTVKGGSVSLPLGDLYGWLKVTAPSGAPPDITVRSKDGTDVADLTGAYVQSGVRLLRGNYLFEFASTSGYDGKLPVTLGKQTTIDLGKDMGFFRIVPFGAKQLPSAEVDDSKGAYEASITPDAIAHTQALPPGDHLLVLDSHSGYVGKIPLHLTPGSHHLLELQHLYGHVTIAPPSGTSLPDMSIKDAKTGTDVQYVSASDAQQGLYLRPGVYTFDLSASSIFLDPVTVSVRAGVDLAVDVASRLGSLTVTPFPHSVTPGFDVRDPSGNNTFHSVDATHALQDLYLRPGTYSLVFSGSSSAFYAPIPLILRAHTHSTVNLDRLYGAVRVADAQGAPISSLEIHDSTRRTLSSVNGPNPLMYLQPGQYSLVPSSSSSSNSYQDPVSVAVARGVIRSANLDSMYAVVTIPGVPSSQSLSYAWRDKADNSAKSVSAQSTAQKGFILPGTYRVEITNGSQSRTITIHAVAGKAVTLPTH
jgi:serine/threonine protein kinase